MNRMRIIQETEAALCIGPAALCLDMSVVMHSPKVRTLFIDLLEPEVQNFAQRELMIHRVRTGCQK
jgi:hypothetical protein